MTDLESAPITGTPRWAKVSGVIIVMLMLVVGLMLLGGRHGPGAHLAAYG